MRGLLGSAYRRASAASAGLCEFRERLQDSSFSGSVRIFGHDGLIESNLRPRRHLERLHFLFEYSSVVRL